MKTFKTVVALLLCAFSAMPVMAQQTYEEMEQLTVNEQVTTVITKSLLSSPLSPRDTGLSMLLSTPQGCRRLLPTRPFSQKRRLHITTLLSVFLQRI